MSWMDGSVAARRAPTAGSAVDPWCCLYGLAERSPLAAEALAKAQNIPGKFLETILAQLPLADIVCSELPPSVAVLTDSPQAWL